METHKEDGSAAGELGRYRDALNWIRNHADNHGQRCPLCTHDHGGHYNGCLLAELAAQPSTSSPSRLDGQAKTNAVFEGSQE